VLNPPHKIWIRVKPVDAGIDLGRDRASANANLSRIYHDLMTVVAAYSIPLKMRPTPVTPSLLKPTVKDANSSNATVSMNTVPGIVKASALGSINHHSDIFF
jgi:hypothetical protein